VAIIFYHSKAVQIPNGHLHVLIPVTVYTAFSTLLRTALIVIRHIRYICELRIPLSASRFRYRRVHLLLRSRSRPNIVLRKWRLRYSANGPSRAPTVANLHKPRLVQPSLKPSLNHDIIHRPTNITNKYVEVFKTTFYRSGSWDLYRPHTHWYSSLCRLPTLTSPFQKSPRSPTHPGGE
jgi:hypothetical protein